MSASWRGAQKINTSPRPAPPMPPTRPLSVCPREMCTQARLQSPDVSSDGYEAEVSMMMERIRKTRKHSGFFNTHTPHPPVSYNSFSQSLPVWLSLCLSVFSVCVEDEAREGAVLVVVASMGFASVQFDVNLVPCVQMEDDAVGGVVVVLVSVLGNGAGTNLQEQGQTNT